jgi:hypothetical protein
VPEPVARKSHQLPDGLRWCEIARIGKLAYDHDEIVSVVRDRLRARLQSTTIARHLIAPRFTLSELQDLALQSHRAAA